MGARAALGRQQAAAAAETLAGERIGRIICSPYTRALQTAAPLARRLGRPGIVTPTVRERYAGSAMSDASGQDKPKK